MKKKTILLVEDDAKIVANVNEILGQDYNLKLVEEQEKLQSIISKNPPDLIIIDFDLKKQDGLQLFNQLKTSLPIIMLSNSNDIPLAVKASKAGVEAFLRKPINPEQLLKVVAEKTQFETSNFSLRDELNWFLGESLHVKQMFQEIRQALKTDKDIILLGERGIPKSALVQLIHQNSSRKKRKICKFDLNAYQKEDLEAVLWSSLQKMLALPEANSLQAEKDRCGLVYFKNFEQIDSHFQLTLFDYFKKRKGSVDKSIRVVIGIYNQDLIDRFHLDDYALIKIPPLRERKADLFYLLRYLLDDLCAKYNKKVEAFSAEALEFLLAYDYPGNYLELKRILELAMISVNSKQIGLGDLVINNQVLTSMVVNQSKIRQEKLSQASQRFEKALYSLLLQKEQVDQGLVTKFLSLPQTILAERLEDLAN